MKIIFARIWNEPSVCIGFLVSLAGFIAAWAIKGLATLETAQVLAIIAPLITSLGIRQFVSPATSAASGIPVDTGDAAAERKGGN